MGFFKFNVSTHSKIQNLVTYQIREMHCRVFPSPISSLLIKEVINLSSITTILPKEKKILRLITKSDTYAKMAPLPERFLNPITHSYRNVTPSLWWGLK